MANDPRLRRTRPHVEWQPKQATAPSVHDYRNAALGPKGYKEGKGKRRLEEMEALHQQDLEQATAQMQADDHAQAMQTDDKPTSKRQRVDDAGGFRMIPVRPQAAARACGATPASSAQSGQGLSVTRALTRAVACVLAVQESGRVWKAPAKPAADIMKVKTKATWEEKQEAKATRQALLEQKREAVAAAKEQRKVRCVYGPALLYTSVTCSRAHAIQQSIGYRCFMQRVRVFVCAWYVVSAHHRLCTSGVGRLRSVRSSTRQRARWYRR